MTDHKGTAINLIASEDVQGRFNGRRDSSLVLAEAQVHATLYLADQQRIANLIVLATIDDMSDPTTSTWQDGFWETARIQIVEGLGLK